MSIGRLFFLALICGLALGALKLGARSDHVCGVDASYVVVDLSHGGYKASPALAAGGNGSEEFEAMVERLRPYAIITGTYYDDRRHPIGDIVINGKVAARGYQRQGIGFTGSGKIAFRERKPGSKIDWRGCRAGLACGPRLVRAGNKDINVVRDGFGKSAATKRASRCAVGATRNGKLILCIVADSVTLSALADVMIELGARDAINLDGGAMCAFYIDGTYKARPLSPINNALVVYRRK